MWRQVQVIIFITNHYDFCVCCANGARLWQTSGRPLRRVNGLNQRRLRVVGAYEEPGKEGQVLSHNFTAFLSHDAQQTIAVGVNVRQETCSRITAHETSLVHRAIDLQPYQD